jgi:predicted HicB family RNase H-like nuclease
MTDDAFGSAADGSVGSEQDTSDLEEDVAEEETTQLNVEIPKSLHRRLKVKSARTDTPLKRIVANVLDRNLDT